MFSQISSFVFVEARKWYGFGTTWEWVNDDADLFFWINYSYKISHLDSFWDFPRTSCWSDLKFPSYLYFFFYWRLTCITTWISFFTMFVLIKRKVVPGPCFQIHRHLNVKYYSAKAGLWQFVIILQYKVAKKKYCWTAKKVFGSEFYAVFEEIYNPTCQKHNCQNDF